MDLDFSEEQQMIIDMTRSMLAEHSTSDIVRSVEDDATGYPEVLWKQMSELGLNGLLIPESYGGGGQTLVEASLVYEELGRAMAPTPHFVSCVMSAGVLLAAGSDAQKDEWLAKIAGGDAILTPAWLEPNRGYGGGRHCSLGDDRWRRCPLERGESMRSPLQNRPARLVVLARGPSGVDLFLVDPTRDGISRKQLLSQGREPHDQIDFDDDVRVSAADRIGAPRKWMGDLEYDHAPGHRPARRAGHRRRHAMSRRNSRVRE